MSNQTLAERCGRIEVLVLDVDGVLTDGGIVYGSSELELKQFHVRDGSGLKVWQLAGKRAAIITGRSSPVVQVRAAELGVEPVVQGAADKLAAYRQGVGGAGLRPGRGCKGGGPVPALPAPPP